MRLGLYSAVVSPGIRPFLETEMSSKPDDLEAVRSIADTLQPFANDDRAQYRLDSRQAEATEHLCTRFRICANIPLQAIKTSPNKSGQ